MYITKYNIKNTISFFNILITVLKMTVQHRNETETKHKVGDNVVVGPLNTLTQLVWAPPQTHCYGARRRSQSFPTKPQHRASDTHSNPTPSCPLVTNDVVLDSTRSQSQQGMADTWQRQKNPKERTTHQRCNPHQPGLGFYYELYKR